MSSLDEIKNLYNEQTEPKMEELKKVLAKHAEQLKRLDLAKYEVEFELKKIKDEIYKTSKEIRQLWSPHIQGAESATLDCNGIEISIESEEIVSIEDKERALEWLIANGYKDAMKYDLHSGTVKKIARENKEKSGTKIPGLKYSNLQFVKVK